MNKSAEQSTSDAPGKRLPDALASARSRSSRRALRFAMACLRCVWHWAAPSSRRRVTHD